MADIDSSSAPIEVQKFIESISDYPTGRFEGRGIICSAGRIRYQTCAFVLFNLLRELGCELPVICYHLGDSEYDSRWEKLVRPLGVDVVDLRQYLATSPHRRLNGWESKAYGLLHCPFEEVLLLDADIVPVRDPTDLFDSREYRNAGAVLWPDRPGDFSAECFRVFGDIPPQPVRPVESGQMLCHKRICWPQINLANFYNDHSEFYYDYVHGDKDTFLMAWLKLGTEPVRPPDCRRDDKDWCFIQHWLDGSPLFWHVADSARKLVPYESGEHMSAEFPHRARVLELLHDLGRRWGMAPPKDVQRNHGCYSIVSGQHFAYRRAGVPERVIAFSEDERFLGGVDAREQQWWMTEEGDVAVSGDEGVIAWLSPGPDGSLHGPWGKRGESTLTLVPHSTTGRLVPYRKTRISTFARDGFNGCLVPEGNRYHLIYRADEQRLATCQVSGDLKAIDGTDSILPISHNVDPRIVRVDSRIFMSTSYYGFGLDCERVELWPLQVTETGLQIGHGERIAFDGIEDDPAYVSRREKNWTPWAWKGRLFYTHQISPHRILEVDFENKCARLIHESLWESDAWLPEWGHEFRGNSPPIALPDGTFLSTFHTPGVGGYYCGFFTFEGTPPFRVLQISREPFLRPDDATGSNWRTGMSCLFLLSMHLRDGQLRLCGGDNDHSVVVLDAALNDVLNSLVTVRPIKPATFAATPSDHFTVRKDPHDLLIMNEVYFNNEYHLPERLDGKVVLDIGAHIGAFACRCLDRGAARVICYEPSESSFRVLQRNLSQYGTRAAAYPHPVGPSQGNASVFFQEYPRSQGQNVSVLKLGKSLSAVGLDQILNDHGPVDILKLDCEGMEYPILYSSDSLSGIPVIVGEYHDLSSRTDINPELISFGPFSREGLAAYLSNRGYHLRFFQDWGDRGVFLARRGSE